MAAMAAALRHQTALAPCRRGQCAVLREAAALRCYRPPALATGIRRQCPILGETAFVVRDVGSTLAGNLALLFLLHASETARRSGALAPVLMSHDLVSCSLYPVQWLLENCLNTLKVPQCRKGRDRG